MLFTLTRTLRHTLTTGSKTPIQSLTQLYDQPRQTRPDLSRSHYQPGQLFSTTLACLKARMYQHPEPQSQLIDLLQQYKTNINYSRHLVHLLVPPDQMFMRINDVYLDIAENVLSSGESLHEEDVYYICSNLDRIIAGVMQEWKDDLWIMRDYSKEQRITEMLLPRLAGIKYSLGKGVLVNMCSIANALSVQCPEFADYMARELHSPECRLALGQIMQVLQLLSNHNVFPYEYFYARKRKFISTIESLNQYAPKKSQLVIRFFHLLVVEDPMHCELLIKRTQDILMESLPSLDGEEVANLWLLCQKAKFGISHRIYAEMLGKIRASLGMMGEKELCLLVRGFGAFRQIRQYAEEARSILQSIQQVLNPNHEYEHELIKTTTQFLNDSQ